MDGTAGEFFSIFGLLRVHRKVTRIISLSGCVTDRRTAVETLKLHCGFNGGRIFPHAKGNIKLSNVVYHINQVNTII